MIHHGNMATHTLVTLVDDFDGSKADLTVAFALEGKSFEIDLNKKHADELRKAMQPFIDKARRTRGIVSDGTRRRRASSSPSASSQEERTAIREWAMKNGVAISDRGRIARSIVEQFQQAQMKATAAPAPTKRAGRKETVDA